MCQLKQLQNKKCWVNIHQLSFRTHKKQPSFGGGKKGKSALSWLSSTIKFRCRVLFSLDRSQPQNKVSLSQYHNWILQVNSFSWKAAISKCQSNLSISGNSCRNNQLQVWKTFFTESGNTKDVWTRSLFIPVTVDGHFHNIKDRKQGTKLQIMSWKGYLQEWWLIQVTNDRIIGKWELINMKLFASHSVKIVSDYLFYCTWMIMPYRTKCTFKFLDLFSISLEKLMMVTPDFMTEKSTDYPYEQIKQSLFHFLEY